MIEPFLYVMNGTLEEPAYYEIAPVEFKNPMNSLTLVPITSRILSMDREFYTTDEIKADPNIMRMANENMIKNQIRKNTDNDFISIRSNKTDVPCAAVFLLPNREKMFKALGIDINDYYVIFITSDEVLFAEKAKFKPTQIRKLTANMKNKMTSLCPNGSPILCTEVFQYDQETSKYIEV